MTRRSSSAGDDALSRPRERAVHAVPADGPTSAGPGARPGPVWPWLLGVCAYALLSHLLMLHAAERAWAVLALLAPGMLAAAGAALAARRVALALACLAGVAALIAWSLAAGPGNVQRLYLAQHAGIHLALAATFAHSLREGGVPMITHFALRVHGERMTADMRAYTRRLTRLWCAYFAGMALTSVVLYAAAPWAAWSVFANLLTPLSAAALFIGEHLVRYRLHPEFDRVPWREALRASRSAGKA